MMAEKDKRERQIKRILVTGDAGSDLDVYLHFTGRNPPQDVKPTRISQSLGGAGLAYRVLVAWAGEHAGAVGFVPPLRPNPPVFAAWNLKPLGDRFKTKSTAFDKVWRLVNSVNPGDLATDDSFQPPQPAIPAHAGKEFAPEIILIQDDAAAFRHPRGMPLPVAPFWGCPESFVVWKMSQPLCRGDLWWQAVEAGVPDRTLVVVTLNDLRGSPVRVSCGISWERTALEIARELDGNPALANVRSAAHVIVLIHGEGALWRRKTGNRSDFRLFFDAGHMERESCKPREIEGTAYGYTTTFAAALAAGLAAGNEDRDEALRTAVHNGLHAMRLLRVYGHGPDVDAPDVDAPGLPVSRLGSVLRSGRHGVTDIAPGAFADYGEVTLPAEEVANADSKWSIALSEPHRPTGEPLYGLARRVAVYGESQLGAIPHARFGKLLTADRNEIEALRNLKTLMDEYVRDRSMTKPLSLAVFGPPGAGKSFGVKQIAKEVLGEDCPVLEFNLSQFTEADLAGAFHQVRDKVLEGRMPLVFWDEFDSSSYKWLQLLLAPMNDGKFQEGQLTHPIGRCVFVFAGGTSDDMEHFGPKKPGADSSKDEVMAWNDFKLHKGPDFVSRIHGYLNVLGPNQKKDGPPAEGGSGGAAVDVGFPLRRALLLRALLGCKGSRRLDMDPGLLSAILEVGRYTNGARSFEKICHALRAAAGKGGPFRPSHLPSDAVLTMNVMDLSEFRSLLKRDEAFKAKAPLLAKAFHEVWRAGKRAKLGDESFQHDCEFDDLPSDKQYDNLDAAMRMPRNLLLGGLWLVSADRAKDDTMTAIPEHLVDIMAREEHYQWMESAVANGFRLPPPGQPRDDEQLLHDCLVDWEDLAEDKRDYDRWFVRKYPEFAQSAGFAIVARRPAV